MDFVNDGTMVLWRLFFHALNEDADLGNLSIDSTCVKVHSQSAEAKKGIKLRISSVYWYKLWWKEHHNSFHCDGSGNSVSFLLSDGKFMIARWQSLFLRQ